MNSVQVFVPVTLAHVFTDVLISEFEQDIEQGKDADQRQRWVKGTGQQLVEQLA